MEENNTYTCQYCGRVCKNLNSLRQHEIRCKKNPNHIICKGNGGKMPPHLKSWNDKQVVCGNGDILDITNKQLEEYKKEHLTCEICGRTIDEAVKWKSKFAARNFCVDHDHNTNKFRGLLCSVCNRQLGWYEKHQSEINNYLNK